MGFSVRNGSFIIFDYHLEINKFIFTQIIVNQYFKNYF